MAVTVVESLVAILVPVRGPVAALQAVGVARVTREVGQAPLEILLGEAVVITPPLVDFA